MHKGEVLFWYDHNNPDGLPKNIPDLKAACEYFGVDYEKVKGEEYKVSEPLSGFHFSVRGFDCEGTPAFSNYTQNHVANFEDLTPFIPLTVGMVVKWWGYFLYQLENVKLK